jgi:hypothetical protein
MPKPSQPALPRLVKEWFSSDDPSSKERPENEKSKPEISVVIFDLLAEEGRARKLIPETPFHGAWEISRFFIERNSALPEEIRSNREAAYVALADQLRKPLRKYKFLISAPTMTSEDFAWRADGPTALTILVQKAGELPGLTVQGAINAATTEGAVTEVERLIDTVLGAMRTVGMCFYVDRTAAQALRSILGGQGPAERPTIMLDGEQKPLAALYADRLSSMVFSMPELSRLEKQAGQGAERQIRAMRKLLENDSRAGRTIRNACRLAINAEDAHDPGVFVTLAFTCLEGLLLDAGESEQVLGRLVEAIVFALDTPPSERAELRQDLKALYKARSTFTHTGHIPWRARLREHTLDIVHRVLRREIELLPIGEPAAHSDSRESSDT